MWSSSEALARLRAATRSEKIKEMQVEDYFVELLTLTREIHAMLKAQQEHQA